MTNLSISNTLRKAVLLLVLLTCVFLLTACDGNYNSGSMAGTDNSPEPSDSTINDNHTTPESSFSNESDTVSEILDET